MTSGTVNNRRANASLMILLIAPAGAHVEITTSCACGGETHGTARVLEVLETLGI